MVKEAQLVCVRSSFSKRWGMAGFLILHIRLILSVTLHIFSLYLSRLWSPLFRYLPDFLFRDESYSFSFSGLVSKYDKRRAKIFESLGTWDVSTTLQGTNMLSLGFATEGVCARGGPHVAKADNE